MKLLALILLLGLIGCEDHNDETVFHNKAKVINGTDGSDGANGTNGKDGIGCIVAQEIGLAWLICGDTKAAVYDGEQGIQGASGTKGDKGDKGHTGLAGKNGSNGSNGASGKDGQSCSVVDGDESVTIKCADSSAEVPKYTSNEYEAYHSINHVIYFPTRIGLATHFRFTEGMSGYYKERVNGTARLTGVLAGITDPAMGFIVDIQFRDRTDVAPADSPKLGSNTGADISQFYYYTQMTGILTGTGKLAGLKLRITGRGPAFQVGVGANYHDMDFGASSWFSYEVLQNSKCEEYEIFDKDLAWQTGDLNLDLVEIE